MKIKLRCPECDCEIELEDVLEGEIISCEDCGVDLEVKKKADGTYELVVAESEGEDWGE
ncbi:MAG: lysine biosynthesis protein LysW [Candidatus Verstraetearchaeota archaeon]|nr:lysine biosynthesis protein LysW [Candidatus Verstraetearchaeota archaeon]